MTEAAHEMNHMTSDFTSRGFISLIDFNLSGKKFPAKKNKTSVESKRFKLIKFTVKTIPKLFPFCRVGKFASQARKNPE